MPKPPKTVYACSSCGAQFSRWMGRCTECGAWSTVAEETSAPEDVARVQKGVEAKPGRISAFKHLDAESTAPRRPSGLVDLDRVLAGGFVPGSVTLVGGEPGVGKSTLLAQAAIALARGGSSILYVTGEESPSQVALRLKRMSSDIPEKLTFLDATDANVVAATIRDAKPDLTIVDSIQAMQSPELPGGAGSISQTKACAGIITEAAKQSNAPVILIGQVNKDGDIAGPRLLEHLVDTVLMLEGDADRRFRLLRAMKHRFGPTDEVAVYTMTETGLTSVDDPSAELLRDRAASVPGSVVSCLLEGRRPLLIELQALVSPAGYGTPVRHATGIDSGRLGLLLAVLARRAGVRILDKDVYANAAGGIKAREPAADLAICLAVASAASDITIDAKTAAVGEVGLGGEIRPVPFADARVRECERHGFTTIVLPRGSDVKRPGAMTIIEAGTIREAIDRGMAG
jgi:DNA repair protein RadA/Sms